MTKKLEGAPARVLKGRRYGGAAGTVAVVALCASLVGLGLLAVAEDEYDLVTGTDALQWRVLDRYVVNENFVGWNGAAYETSSDINLESWHHRNPATIPDGGISFPFNAASTKEYTTYLVTYQATDLTDKEIVAEMRIVYDSTPPVFEAREQPGAEAFVRLFFQSTTPEGWSCSDYWWSNVEDLSYYLKDILKTSTEVSFTITVPLDGTCWSDRDGHWGLDYKTSDGKLITHAEAFADAVSNAQEIGLSFGGGSYFANGVALTLGEATFELLSFTIG